MNANELTFHYIKDNDFRTVLSTGAIGGVTVNRLININFYSSRWPIPKSTTFNILDNNSLSESPIDQDSKEGVIREVHFGIYMDVQATKDLIDFLHQQIRLLESNL